MSDAANTLVPLPDGTPDLNTLAGEYVLGTLSWARRQQVAAQLPTDAALRQAVADWQAHLLPLTALAEPVEPAAALWSRISASLDAQAAPAPAASWGAPAQLPAHAPQARHANPAQRPAQPASARPSFGGQLWANLALWRALAGAGFAAAVVLAVVLLSGPALVPAAPAYLVVLVAPANQSAGWIVQARSSGQLELQPVGAGADAALPADKSLQFWTKADGWSKPVSLGLVTPGQTLRIPLDALPPLQDNQLFELTIEPAGGSPTQLPTGPIQFIGRAVKLAT